MVENVLRGFIAAVVFVRPMAMARFNVRVQPVTMVLPMAMSRMWIVGALDVEGVDWPLAVAPKAIVTLETA